VNEGVGSLRNKRKELYPFVRTNWDRGEAQVDRRPGDEGKGEGKSSRGETGTQKKKQKKKKKTNTPPTKKKKTKTKPKKNTTLFSQKGEEGGGNSAEFKEKPGSGNL